MNTDENLLQSVKEVALQINDLRNRAHQQYSVLVKQVLSDRISDKQSIEKIMDGLLDFCDEDRFIDIYRQLCRHIYHRHPTLVGEHVALFRAQFETNEDRRLENDDQTTKSASSPALH